MQASDQSNESLHQQASAQYLQGKFDEALDTWRQILTGDPQDERAVEGVRLCELLTEDGATEAEAADDAESAATSDEQPNDAGETNDAALEDSIEFEVPNLEIDLPEKPAADAPSRSKEFDLGEVQETLDLDGEIPEVPALESCAEAVEPQAATTTAELTTSVQNLVAEAQAAYNTGDIETARTVLTRVFILDESNAAALQLQEQVESAIPASAEQIDVADLDAPDHDAAPGEFDLAADAPENSAAAAVIPPAPSAPTEGEPALTSESLDDPTEDSFPEFDVDAEFEEEGEETSEVESEAAELVPSKIKLPQLGLGSMKTRWIVIGVALGIFVMVGVGLWMRLRSTEIPEAPLPIAMSAEAAPQLEVNTEPEPDAQVTQVEPEPAPQLNVTPPEDLATLLERGNNAFDAGDYSSAIVAFNAVLKQQPNHFEAGERMQAATEGYRQQQEIQQQWVAAASLFRDGEYRSAMQMFYRLPKQSEDKRLRLERYKENGWFNMGLLALRSGQCDLARAHLEEAAQVDPEDADITMALTLCDTCEGGTSRKGFRRAVASLSLRGLDD